MSSDMFADHIYKMDLVMRAQFKRWQQHYQWKMAGFDQDQPIFAVCTGFIVVSCSCAFRNMGSAVCRCQYSQKC